MARTTYPLKLYIKQPAILSMVILSLLVNIFMWFWLLYVLGPQQDPIFLHYNILFGVDLIGEWWNILYLPITGIFILIINFILGWVLFHKDKFIAYILNAVNLICQVFLLVATLLIVFLNL
ncbi:MAG: hypothetical protein L3J07_01925 [Candidatus Magasanikbacteria bacterium]|nr:hypothetical protein [Candidatus Magasanikbacteria bacterium]